MDIKTNILTITELTRAIKFNLESSFQKVVVQGEISNFKRHTSGHVYFTLKDEGAQLSAVLWRSRVGFLKFEPADGMKVVATGNITVYEPRGNYQLDVQSLQPLGIGELQLAFERLKQKLMKEGLFDEERKKPIPQFPGSIGIVTSPTGVALRDIMTIISRRYPLVELILVPVRVQGEGAAEEIAEGIKLLNEFGNVDVMIVGRGGGSLEDLWPFNEEVVARAIANSNIPVISAVGHEIDFSISDFVADLRAPTPSAAAELAVPDKEDILETLRNYRHTLQSEIENIISNLLQRVEQCRSSYFLNRPIDLLHQYSQRCDELERTLRSSVGYIFSLMRQRIEALSSRMESLSPDLTLKRGYAMVFKDEKIVRSVAQVHSEDSLKIKVYDGTIQTRVE